MLVIQTAKPQARAELKTPPAVRPEKPCSARSALPCDQVWVGTVLSPSRGKCRNRNTHGYRSSCFRTLRRIFTSMSRIGEFGAISPSTLQVRSMSAVRFCFVSCVSLGRYPKSWDLKTAARTSMFPNWLVSVSSMYGYVLFGFDLRMHGSKNVGNYQSSGTGAGIELDVLAVRSSANTVESNRTLDCGVDALDGDSNNSPLVI